MWVVSDTKLTVVKVIVKARLASFIKSSSNCGRFVDVYCILQWVICRQKRLTITHLSLGRVWILCYSQCSRAVKMVWLSRNRLKPHSFVIFFLGKRPPEIDKCLANFIAICVTCHFDPIRHLKRQSAVLNGSPPF